MVRRGYVLIKGYHSNGVGAPLRLSWLQCTYAIRLPCKATIVTG